MYLATLYVMYMHIHLLNHVYFSVFLKLSDVFINIKYSVSNNT